MSEAIKVGTFAALAYAQSAAIYAETHKLWISKALRFESQFGAVGLGRYQSDCRWDLVLRCLEDETVERHKLGADADSWSAEIQLSLSRYWLLSTYEWMRVAKNASETKSNSVLQQLFHDIELVRVSVAKFEIAKDRKLPPEMMLYREGDPADAMGSPYSAGTYHPPMGVNLDTGSVFWYVIDAERRMNKYVYRREISDRILALE
jgi:hypothetical protein